MVNIGNNIRSIYNSVVSAFTASNKIQRKINRIFKMVVPTDGLDEAAVALISFLPKVVQPPVTAGVLTLLAPLVRSGGREMATDHQELLNEKKNLDDIGLALQEKILSNPKFYEELQKDNLPSAYKKTLEGIADYQGDNKTISDYIKVKQYLKAYENSDIPDDKKQEIKEFIENIEIPNLDFIVSDNNLKTMLEKINTNFSQEKIFQDTKNNTSDTLIDDIVKFQHNQKQQSLANYPKTMYAGTFAMGGMTTGVVSGALQAFAQTAEQFGVKPNIMNVTQNALSVATQAIFIPSQAAMALFGVNIAWQGIQKNRYLEQQKKALEKYKDNDNKDIVDKTIKHINAVKRNNIIGDVVYGLGTAAAETGMIVGGLMGSSAILIPAAMLTLGFAGLRMYANNKEADLTGNAHDHDHNGDILKMLRNPKAKETQEAETHIHSATCNHTQDGAFITETNKIKENFASKINDINTITGQLAIVKDGYLEQDSVKNVKDIIYNLLPIDIKTKNVKKTVLDPLQNASKGNDAKFIKKTTKEKIPQNQVFAKLIFDNENAQDTAIDILITELGKNMKSYATLLEASKSLSDNEQQKTDDYKEKLAKITENLNILNNYKPQDTNSQDEDAKKAALASEETLKTIFADNMDILDKSENAKKILPHLLNDRMNDVKQSLVFNMNNVIHLAQKAQFKKTFVPST